MKTYNKTAAAGLALCAAFFGGNAFAAIQTLSGTHVTYSFDDTKLGLFGTNFSVVGDSLLFAPSNFSTATMATQTINVTVTANTGYLLSGFSLAESGGYALSGGAVSVAGSLTASDIGGDSMTNVYGSLVPTYNGTTWSAQAGVSLPATGWGSLSSANLTLWNLLQASGGASISKNAAQILAVTTPVPEADTYAMLLVGLGLVGFMARRGRMTV